MKYRPDLPLVLTDLNVRIKPGEKIGIVGRTGAGKSSLAQAFFRLVEPHNGRIIIDSIDVTNIGLDELRSKLTIISQDPLLLSGTIASNLDMFGEFTKEEMLEAIELVNLKEQLDKLP